MVNYLNSAVNFIFVLIVLISCEKKITYDNSCGILTHYEVDKEYCEKFGLEKETFELKYPSQLVIETQEDYPSSEYVSFFKYDKDSTLIETINIGYYYGVNGSGGSSLLGGFLGITKESLLNTIINDIKNQGLNLEEVTMKDEKMLGEDRFTARGQFESNEDLNGFKGKYLIQIVMISTGSKHGLLLIMFARDDSGITTFNDFEKNGCISPILQSLDY